MKILLFSDIHGNQYAFRAFMEQLEKEKYDLAVFCGDILGYYYGQEEIVEGLQNIRNLYAVKGNHDEYGLKVRSGQLRKQDLWERYGHSYGETSERVLNYIERLEPVTEWSFQGKKYGIMHGTAQDHLEGRLYPKDEIPEELAHMYQKYDVVFYGHTHFRTDRFAGKTRLINPGSLGQQRDGLGFCHAFYDTDTEKLVYKKLNFDLKPLEEEIDLKDPENKKLKEILHRGEHA